MKRMKLVAFAALMLIATSGCRNTFGDDQSSEGTTSMTVTVAPVTAETRPLLELPINPASELCDGLIEPDPAMPVSIIVPQTTYDIVCADGWTNLFDGAWSRTINAEGEPPYTAVFVQAPKFCDLGSAGPIIDNLLAEQVLLYVGSVVATPTEFINSQTGEVVTIFGYFTASPSANITPAIAEQTASLIRDGLANPTICP